MGIIQPFWDMPMTNWWDRPLAAKEAEAAALRQQVPPDLSAFAQMQRFVQTTGRGLTVDVNRDHANIITNYSETHGLNEGWKHPEPEIVAMGATFAAAWEKFCGYWPEAGKS